MHKVHTIKRDYLIDVLGDAERKESVTPNFYLFNNAGMISEFGYEVTEMENYSSMLQDNGTSYPVCKDYFKVLFDAYFNGTVPISGNPKKLREIREKMTALRVADAATMIFVPNDKTTHGTLKNVIEEIDPSMIVIVLNGDNTSNAEAEEIANQAIKDSNGHLEKVVFISSIMANRSFSVSAIKNIVLLLDSTSSNGIQQKVARSFTPWDKFHRDSKIVEFLLSDIKESCISKWLTDISISTLSNNASKTMEEVIDIIDRLTFIEYFALGDLPFREMTKEEIKNLLHSTDYNRCKALKVVYKCLNEIAMPTRCGIDADLDVNILFGNVKGDSDRRRVYTASCLSDKGINNVSEIKEDLRIKYLAFLLKEFPTVFDTGKYTEDKLNKEFNENMTKERKTALETVFNIDMNVMCQIANMLVNHGIELN